MNIEDVIETIRQRMSGSPGFIEAIAKRSGIALDQLGRYLAGEHMTLEVATRLAAAVAGELPAFDTDGASCMVDTGEEVSL